MGHIGYTPQFKKKFKIEGKTSNKQKNYLKKLYLYKKQERLLLYLNAYLPNTSKLITKKLKIPTIGIGASSFCDGQILVTDDMLGISGFYPKFVKKYVI